MKLHILPPSPRATKVIATKNLVGLECEERVLDYLQAEQRSAEFLRLNPNGRQPVLQDGDFTLWESNAIMQYLASSAGSKLWPEEPRQQADVLRWLFWEASHWDPACDMFITERMKKAFFETSEHGRRTHGKATRAVPPDEGRLEEARRYFADLARILDHALVDRSWLAGDSMTLADVALAAWVPASEPAGYSVSSYANIVRWYSEIERIPAWRASIFAP